MVLLALGMIAAAGYFATNGVKNYEQSVKERVQDPERQKKLRENLTPEEIKRSDKLADEITDKYKNRELNTLDKVEFMCDVVNALHTLSKEE